MKFICNIINCWNLFLGRITAWLLLASVLVSAGNAILRKAFSIGSNSMLELQWYLVGTVVMLGCAWVIQEDGHVRIEIFAGRMPRSIRKWVELLGHLLMLLPFAGLLLCLSWPFFVRSFELNEVSLSSGGLLVWPIRGIIVLGFATIVAQALVAVLATLQTGKEEVDHNVD